MTPHLSTNFEIKKYYQKEPKVTGVYSRNNLTKIKDGTYDINLVEYESVGAHWIALYVNGNNIIYFDSFRVEHIPKEIKIFKGNKNVITTQPANIAPQDIARTFPSNVRRTFHKDPI